MHPLESGMGVPAFLAKLWRLVEDSETNNLISWSSDGRSFIIQNQAKFAKELLPLNYKHNNMASFIRQLNMYGFHKITSIDNGGLKFDKDEMEFSHPYFQKGHPYLLEHIKRKIANPKASEAEKVSPKTETVTRVLSEVKNMRGRQDSLDTRFSAMKQENEALWREVAILRQKHLKQQQIVNKLIQFLVTIVQPQRSGLNSGIGKRRCHLMINDAPQSKMRKSNEGPVIRELTEELLDDVDSDFEEAHVNSANVQSPGSQSSKDQDASNSVGSVDGLGLDEIDEIDTKNMAIYSADLPIKKERSTGGGAIINTSVTTAQQKQLKNENTEAKPTKMPETPKMEPSASKSLLLPNSAENIQELNSADADLMLNILGDSTGQMAGSNVALNTGYDEMSQPPNDLLDDDMFAFGKVEEMNPEGMIVTKYNPKHTNDIMRLNSATDYSSHIDNVQNDLDSLKDLLSSDSYQLDPNQLMGNVELPYSVPGSFDSETINKLFGSDDLVGYEMSPTNMDLFVHNKKDDNNSGSGSKSELMAYQPSPFNNSLDLNELLQNVGDVESISKD